MFRSLIRTAYRAYVASGRAFLRPLLVREWKQSLERSSTDDTLQEGVNERPTEYVFALRSLSDLAPRSVLDHHALQSYRSWSSR